MGKSILIVEDEQNIVDILSFNLSREGYDTLEAYDGPTGLQLALEQDPDLILLDLMLPEGLIVYTEDKNGEREEYTSDEENQFHKPLVVMMNGYSASASEIYAGAIQDYGIGQIVGTKTYGKGVVQTIYDLKDGTSLKLTVAEYFTPNGRNIDGEGITPDVEVAYQRDENDPEADNQLDRAVEALQDEMAP